MGERVSILCTYLFHRYFEIAIWSTALVLLTLMPPNDVHYSLCPLKAAGIDFCPGCGLGHSLSWLLHGEFRNSLHTHPLGVFALGVLVYRIITLGLKLKEN